MTDNSLCIRTPNGDDLNAVPKCLFCNVDRPTVARGDGFAAYEPHSIPLVCLYPSWLLYVLAFDRG